MKPYSIKLSVLMLLVVVMTGCASLTTRPEAPRVSLIGLKPISMDLFEQRFMVSLRVKNPNQFVLPIRGLDFNMDINGNRFADGLSATNVDIPALGEGRVDIEVSSSLLNTLRQFKNILSDQRNFDYQINGNVMLQNKAFRLPFELSDSFSFAGEKSL
jgi:LEA14-like dessication related protein